MQQGKSFSFSDPGATCEHVSHVGSNSEIKMYAFSILTGLHFGAADLYQVNPIIKHFPP